MTVYADNMRRYAKVVRAGRSVTGQWSHLLADDPEELAVFAAHLGLRPEWLQSPGTPAEHYDIVEGIRQRAVAAGALPISYPHSTGNLIVSKQLQASALDAARRGWHVFALRPGSKIPAVRDWENQATADPERIRHIWAVRPARDGGGLLPTRNVGVACGPSGLVVIDLDRPKAGQDRSGWPSEWREADVSSGAHVLAALEEHADEPVPDTYEVATASGGRHLYFAAPEDVHVRNSTSRLGPLIDVRGEGGYVVAAGSRLLGRQHRGDLASDAGQPDYRVVHDAPPARLPSWLADAATVDRHTGDQRAVGSGRLPQAAKDQALLGPSDGYGAAAMRSEVDRVRSAPVGQRNHTLNAAAYNLGQLVAAGALDQTRIVQALADAAELAGLDKTEIAPTIDSGLMAGSRTPRGLPERRTASPAAPAVVEPNDMNPSSDQTDGSDSTAAHTSRPSPEPPAVDSVIAAGVPPEPSGDGASPRAVLEDAIGHARAAVDRLASRAASRRLARDYTSETPVLDDRPAYWTQPEVEL